MSAKRLIATVAAIGLAGLLLVSIAGREARAYPVGWTVQQRVVSTGAVSCDIEAYGCYVWVVWEKSDGSIWLRRSNDSGATWGSPVAIDNGAYPNHAPVVVVGSVSQKNVYVLWSGKRDGDGYYQSQVSQSSDWGATFSRIYHSTGSSNKTGLEACRLPDNNTVIWAWEDDVTGVKEVSWGKISVNGSVTVGTPRSALDGIASRNPVVACSGYADILLAWQDEDGGSYSRVHLVCSRSIDGGSTWGASGSGALPYDVNYRQSAPSATWDQNPIIVYRGQNVTTGNYYVGRYGMSTMGGSWSPNTVEDSVKVYTGSVAPYPEVIGSAYSDIFHRNSSEYLSEYSIVDNFFGSTKILIGTKSVSLASTSNSAQTNLEYVAAATSGNEIYFRRRDAVSPSIAITEPELRGVEDMYFGSNFLIECLGCCDDFDVNGDDVTTGETFIRGVRDVTYYYTTDEISWEGLPCTAGGNLSQNPPYEKEVDSLVLKNKRIKIKAKAVDSAGNTGEYVTPGWIFMDLDKPHTNLKASGTKGNSGWYRSSVKVKLSSADPTFDHSEYRLENGTAGLSDANWTRYETPFELGEARWRVHYRSIDKAGNVELPKTANVNVDITPPQCSVTRPVRDTIQTGYYSDESFRVTGTGTDANNLSWGAIYIDGTKRYETSSGFNMACVWKLADVEEGVHRIEVKARDLAGNTGSGSRHVYVGNVAKDWYFAEGNTLPEFDEYICIMNPGDREARVQLSFMLETGEVRTAERRMAPHQRDTVRVKDYVDEGHVGVSTRVHSDDQAVIAERPMYFVYKKGVPGYDWKGGHNVMGVNVLQLEWYFAEGTTRKNEVDGRFEEWICLQNPSDGQTANVTIQYMLGDGANIIKAYQVAPHSRCTVEVANDVGINQDVSARVVSDVPIAAERPMYFNYHGYAVDGSDVVGASGPATSWSFAEGCTRPGFQQWLTIQNPNDVAATCQVNYMTGSGKTTRVTKNVNPRSRDTIDVLSQVGDNQDVSATVTSDVPVIVERPMYFIYGMEEGKGWTGGESALGNPEPSTTYFLAEGTTISEFDTWYSLLNPRDDGVCKVYIEYIFGDGSTHRAEYDIQPHSRLTINVRDAVNRQADVSGSITASFPIVIERPMYFNYKGAITGGHNVCGYGVD